MKAAAIELHIEELVLHGFAPGDRYGIAAALEQELHRLLADNLTSPQFMSAREVAHQDAGEFAVQRGARAETMGAQIAQTMYRGFGS